MCYYSCFGVYCQCEKSLFGEIFLNLFICVKTLRNLAYKEFLRDFERKICLFRKILCPHMV